MELSSSAFSDGKPIPQKFTCDGQDVSPALSWTHMPDNTRSFALIMDDPDAPSGTWVHWIIYDIPGKSTGLPEGIAKKGKLASGAKQGACWGVDTFERSGYYGPCPPPGKPHHYHFRLYALDKMLDLPNGATAGEVRKAIQGHILDQAELIGIYQR